VPPVPWIVCTIIFGFIALSKGNSDNPIMFLCCAFPGWLLALGFLAVTSAFHNIQWSADGWKIDPESIMPFFIFFVGCLGIVALWFVGAAILENHRQDEDIWNNGHIQEYNVYVQPGQQQDDNLGPQVIHWQDPGFADFPQQDQQLMQGLDNHDGGDPIPNNPNPN